MTDERCSALTPANYCYRFSSPQTYDTPQVVFGRKKAARRLWTHTKPEFRRWLIHSFELPSLNDFSRDSTKHRSPFNSRVHHSNATLSDVLKPLFILYVTLLSIFSKVKVNKPLQNH